MDRSPFRGSCPVLFPSYALAADKRFSKSEQFCDELELQTINVTLHRLYLYLSRPECADFFWFSLSQDLLIPLANPTLQVPTTLYQPLHYQHPHRPTYLCCRLVLSCFRCACDTPNICFQSMSLPDGHYLRRTSSTEQRDPFASPSVYYDDDETVRKRLLGARNRAVSSVGYLLRQVLKC